MTFGEKTDIGGMPFQIKGCESVKFFTEHPIFHDFRRTQPGNCNELQVVVTTRIVENFDPLSGDELFHDNVSWRIVKSGQDRVVVKYSDNKTDWQCRLNPQTRHACLSIKQNSFTSRESFTIFLDPFLRPLDKLLLIYNLANLGRVMVHAASAEIGGRGLAFLGKSETGKSTIARELDGMNVGQVINDEKAILSSSPGGFDLYGTPLVSDAKIALNKKVPLFGLYFLKQDKLNSLEVLTPAEALKRLLPVASVPWFDQEYMDPILTTLEKLVTRTPAYLLHCQKGPAVVKLIQQHVKDFEKVSA